MKNAIFALNIFLILIIISILSYSYIFSKKILNNLHSLNQKSKLYTGFSIPYLEKKNNQIKPKSEVLKSFSNSNQNKAKNKKVTTSPKKKKKSKKKKKKKKLKKQTSLEKRIRYLEKEVKRLKKEKKR